MSCLWVGLGLLFGRSETVKFRARHANPLELIEYYTVICWRLKQYSEPEIANLAVG